MVKRITLFIVSLLVIFNLQAGTIWLETFSDYNLGAYGTDTTAYYNLPSDGSWFVNVDSAHFLDDKDWFKSIGKKMEMKDVKGPVVWWTESIDISGHEDVSISIDVLEHWECEDTDYICAYYVLDIDTVLFAYASGDFDTAFFETSGLSGDSLRIIVKGQNDDDAEQFKFDDVTVFDTPPTCVDVLTRDTSVVLDETFRVATLVSTSVSAGVDSVLWYYSLSADGDFDSLLCAFNEDTFYVDTEITSMTDTLYSKFKAFANFSITATKLRVISPSYPQLDAPLLLPADNVSPNSFVINWQETTGAIGYVLSVYVEDEGAITYILNNDTVIGVSKTVNGLTQGTKYYYMIHAYDTYDRASAVSDTMMYQTPVVTSLQKEYLSYMVSTSKNTLDVSVEKEVNLSVYDVSGHVVLKQKVWEQVSFTLRSGIYFVRINDDVRKVIVY